LRGDAYSIAVCNVVLLARPRHVATVQGSSPACMLCASASGPPVLALQSRRMHTLHSQPSQHDSMIGPVVAQTPGTAYNAECLRLLAAAVTANLNET